MEHGLGPKAVKKIASSHLVFRFVSRKKPILKREARLARLQWARGAQNVDWSSLIWTDESMIRIGDMGRR